MTTKEWVAVAVVIGGGILLQIPSHDEAMMDPEAMGHSEMPAGMAEVEGPYERVALDVTGMT
jgi:hypothetical protein